MISHELRTPLTSIKGFASSLLAQDVKFAPHDQRQFVEIIDEEADKLTDLVEQLLDLTRIQAGIFKIESKVISLSTIIQAVMPQLSSLACQHKLRVQLAENLPPVVADATRIGQVLTNLVGNACKYASEGSQIILSVTPDPVGVKFTVSDQGPGIPAEEHELVFEAFRQSKHHSKTKGAGLGLTIAKALVELHGGTIWIEPQETPGLSISFTLPGANPDSGTLI